MVGCPYLHFLIASFLPSFLPSFPLIANYRILAEVQREHSRASLKGRISVPQKHSILITVCTVPVVPYNTLYLSSIHPLSQMSSEFLTHAAQITPVHLIRFSQSHVGSSIIPVPYDINLAHQPPPLFTVQQTLANTVFMSPYRIVSYPSLYPAHPAHPSLQSSPLCLS